MKANRPLQNLTALVTGASSGIGAATAIAMARNGANVLVHYNTQQSVAASIAAQAREYDVHSATVQADLTCIEGARARGLCSLATHRYSGQQCQLSVEAHARARL